MGWKGSLPWVAWAARLARVLALALASVIMTVPAQASLAEAACYSDWQVAAPIVRDRGLVPARIVRERARAIVKGEIIKIELCKGKGRYYYRLVVYEARGRVRNLIVDAARPFER